MLGCSGNLFCNIACSHWGNVRCIIKAHFFSRTSKIINPAGFYAKWKGLFVCLLFWNMNGGLCGVTFVTRDMCGSVSSTVFRSLNTTDNSCYSTRGSQPRGLHGAAAHLLCENRPSSTQPHRHERRDMHVRPNRTTQHRKPAHLPCICSATKPILQIQRASMNTLVWESLDMPEHNWKIENSEQIRSYMQLL